MVYGGWKGYQAVAPMAECMMAFEDARNAVLAFAKENAGKLPSAAKWEDEIRPYYVKEVAKSKDERGPLATMNENGPWGCKVGSGMTGMAYNSAIAGKLLKDVQSSGGIVLFEVERAGRNLAEVYKARSAETSPEIFGEKRGWITIGMTGSADSPEMGPGKSVRIKTD